MRLLLCRNFRNTAIVGVLCATSGAAAAPPGDVARAESLFQSARQLMREGKFGDACPQFEESQRLDPAPGTQLNLAECWERAGRTASAYREFLAVAQSSEKSGARERAAIARARAQSLENKLTRLAVTVPAGARVPGLQVLENGVPLAESAWGVPHALDPGPIVIEAQAPGRRAFRSEIALPADAALHQLTIPVLAPVVASSEPPSDESSPASRAVWIERAGIGTASLGAVGLVVGTVLGVRAVSLYHRSQDEGCDQNNVCTPEGLETRRSAVSSGNASTISFVIGGALVAGGAGLYVWGARERAEERLSLRLVPQSGGAAATFTSRF